MPAASLPRRPFRFGVQVDGTGGRAEWQELARRIEATGYSTLTMPDHFTGQLAPVPALQCAADATTTLIVPSNMSEVSALIASAMKMVGTGKSV